MAGVSRSTVSRVINNYPNVPQATREKVMQVIEQYNYAPNFSARIMSGKRTSTIGLFMVSREEVFNDSLTNALITRVIESASKRGYYVLTYIIRNTKDDDIMRNVKNTFYQQRIDGGIFIGAANHEPFIEELIADGFVVGVVDQHLEGRREPNRVISNFNNMEGMRQGVDYLYSLGHRQIAHIAGDPLRWSGPEKLEGFRQAMEAHGLQVRSDWIIRRTSRSEAAINLYSIGLIRPRIYPRPFLPAMTVWLSERCAHCMRQTSACPAIFR